MTPLWFWLDDLISAVMLQENEYWYFNITKEAE